MDRATHYQDTRERILAVGEGLILGRGFSAMGLSEILGRAEVPKGSFYHYFRSKEGFGVALLERYFSDYDARLTELLGAGALAPRERLLAYFKNWRDMHAADTCHHTCLAVKLAAEVSDLSEPMRQALAHGMARIVAQLAATVQAGQDAGTLPAQLDAGQLAESLYAMWVGASLLGKVNRAVTPVDLAYKQTEYMLHTDLH